MAAVPSFLFPPFSPVPQSLLGEKEWGEQKVAAGEGQCTRAVRSTFADIHPTHPAALMHYLGLVEFPVRICDASFTTHTRPNIPNLSYDCDL